MNKCSTCHNFTDTNFIPILIPYKYSLRTIYVKHIHFFIYIYINWCNIHIIVINKVPQIFKTFWLVSTLVKYQNRKLTFICNKNSAILGNRNFYWFYNSLVAVPSWLYQQISCISRTKHFRI